MTESSRKIPSKMKAALYKGKRKIELETVDTPSPDKRFVLVKVATFGICGSDLHAYLGRSLRRNFDKWLKLGYADGHELSGTVVKIGEGIPKRLLGKRVVSECATHCGKCMYCRAGFYNICANTRDFVWYGHGAFAEYAHVPYNALHELPANVPFEKGVLAEPLAAAYRAVRRSDLAPHESIFIIGAGTMGLLIAAVAKAFGTRKIGVLAKYPQQIKVAKSLGATKVYSSDINLNIKARKELSPNGFDVIFDTVGTSQGFNTAISLAKKTGRIVLLGGYTGPVEVSLGPVVGSELKVIGSQGYGYSNGKLDFKVAIGLIKNNKIDVMKLVTDVFKFQQVKRAFKVAADKKSGSIKVQIRIQ